MNLRLSLCAGALFAVALSESAARAMESPPPAGRTEETSVSPRWTREELALAAGPVSYSTPRLKFPEELAARVPLPEIVVTTDSPEAAKWTRAGFGFLHMLEFERAERCFHTALARDAGCALASWGVAAASMRTPMRGRAWAKDAFNARERLPEGGPERAAAELLWSFYDEKTGELEERRERLAREFRARAEAAPEDVFWTGQALLWEFLNGGAEFRLAGAERFPVFALARGTAPAPGFEPRTPTALSLKGLLARKRGDAGEAEQWFRRALEAEIALAEADGWAAEDFPAIAWRAETLLEEWSARGKTAEAAALARDLTRLPADPEWNAPRAGSSRRPPSCFLTGARWLEKHPGAPAAGSAPGLPPLRLPIAPAWTLPDAEGRARSLEEFRGKPLLLNFYLDHQCERCMHQMTDLVKRLPEFEQLGIRIVGIGGDRPEDLAKAVTFGENPQPYPFPLLADPDGVAHRAYGCWQGFSDLAQHGTVLIGAEGRLLWRSTEEGPFENMDFLLAECRRLLELEARSAESR